MKAFFWLCFAFAAAAYVVYPVAMVVRARLFAKPLSRPNGPLPEGVSVVLAVRNGARWLNRRIENLLEQDYSPGGVEVLVVSNGSSDGTDEIAGQWAAREPRVRALTSDAAQGKAGAVNAGVAAAKHPLIVFADVRQRFGEGAIGALAAPFRDPEVGAVTGRLVVERSDRPGVAGFGMYWELETRLRMAEAATGSVIGATGAIYAVRRELFSPVPAGTLLDDVYTPLRIAMDGGRVFMAEEAVAYDTPSESEVSEYRRRVRTLAGNLQLLRVLPGVLSPFRGLSWRFFFHKLLRVFSPVWFLGLLVTGILLPGAIHTFTAAVLIAFYVVGLVGLVVRHPILAIPSAFLLVQVAGMEAIVRPRRTAQRLWMD